MSNEPEVKLPEGVDVNDLVMDIGWEVPTWIDEYLFEHEFKGPESNEYLIQLFRALAVGIDKAMATEAGDEATIYFKYWRKLNEKATKMKPVKLKATAYKHKLYDTAWLLVEYA